jgi:hypothetical protein
MPISAVATSAPPERRGMDRIGRFVGRLGGKLGIAVCLLGFLVIYLGWNGAGSFNDLRQQFPYLISGGIAGLAMVIVGAALLVIEAIRGERAELQATLLEVREALAGVGGGRTVQSLPVSVDDMVVAGATSYHRSTCRLVEGRHDLDVLAADEAEARGLSPCRICNPSTASGNGNRRKLKTT